MKKLTIAEISDAFGETLEQEIYKPKMRELNNDLRVYRAHLKDIQWCGEMAFERWLMTRIAEVMMTETERRADKAMSDIRKIRNFTKRRLSGNTMIVPLEDVKRIPFLDIHEFENAKKNGKKIWVRCPFHEDNTNSFVIYPTNTAHCFSCKWGGDTVAFIQKLHGLDFIRAVKMLQGIKK